jgi:stage II sporulation protein AA (anti-sigma F factor antagonist)
MALQLETRGRTLFAVLSGDLDAHSAERMRANLDATFENSPCRNIIFDMAAVTFMDSSGIGMLIGRYKQVSKRGGRIILAAMNPQMDKLFELCGLSKIAAKTASVPNAAALLGGDAHE